jgi:haloacetate dehalogenase
MLALWGRHGVIEQQFDCLADWRAVARNVRGEALDCGHYLPEERPDEVARHLENFLA